MDENMNQIPEQETETTDAFLDGWDGEAEAAADQPEVDAEPVETGEETLAEDPSESAETPGIEQRNSKPPRPFSSIIFFSSLFLTPAPQVI